VCVCVCVCVRMCPCLYGVLATPCAHRGAAKTRDRADAADDQGLRSKIGEKFSQVSAMKHLLHKATANLTFENFYQRAIEVKYEEEVQWLRRQIEEKGVVLKPRENPAASTGGLPGTHSEKCSLQCLNIVNISKYK
jgi:hypothetical protein